MTATRFSSFFLRLAAASITVWCAGAAEYHGSAKSSGLPVPGVAVTAIRGELRVTTTTDDRGAFSFAELADGTWTIEAEMLGFGRAAREVGVAPNAPPVELPSKILSESVLLAALDGVPSPAVAVSSAPTTTSAPSVRAAPPASVPSGAASPRSAANGARTGTQPQVGYQRLNVSQSADSRAIGSEGAIKAEEIADLNQSATNSFIVQGSMSSAAGLPQMNDWGRGGRGMGPDGMGGPGMGGSDCLLRRTECYSIPLLRRAALRVLWHGGAEHDSRANHILPERVFGACLPVLSAAK